MSRFADIVRACTVVAQLAAITFCGTDLAYAECTQSSPCASITKLGTGIVIGGGGLPEEQLILFFRTAAISGDGGVVVGTFLPRAATSLHVFRWTPTTGLNDLTSGVPIGVNRDGSVVVGGLFQGSSEPAGAFRWTSSDLANLGNGVARFVSSDGSVVAGNDSSRAFHWTSAGRVDLGTLGGRVSSIRNMNSDGSIVVGESEVPSSDSSASKHAFRWTSAIGLVDLGTLGGTGSVALATNSDGSVIVGTSSTTANTFHAFRWTKETGMADLGTLGGDFSRATFTSTDGSVVVGESSTATPGDFHAFRWSSATGMVDLGTLGDDNRAITVTGISIDGSVIVGSVGTKQNPLLGKRAYRWTSATGMLPLEELLFKAGVNVTDVRLIQASGVSEDGKSIIGLGIFPMGTARLGHGYFAHFNE